MIYTAKELEIKHFCIKKGDWTITKKVIRNLTDKMWSAFMIAQVLQEYSVGSNKAILLSIKHLDSKVNKYGYRK